MVFHSKSSAHTSRFAALALGAVLLVGCGSGDPTVGSNEFDHTEHRTPCTNGSCWNTDAAVAECGFEVVDENFASGNYNVHRYASRLWAGTTTHVRVARSAGDWAPAVIVVDRLSGATIFDGAAGAQNGSLTTKVVDDGTDGGVVDVRFDLEGTSRDVDIFVTGWSTLNSNFTADLPQSAKYQLTVDDDCSGVDPIDATAPDGAVPGEVRGFVGDNPITANQGSWGPAIRFDVPAGTHVSFGTASVGVAIEVLRWNGSVAHALGVSDASHGERVLAVLDPTADRTYWVRAEGGLTTTLFARYTPFDEGARCQSDCSRLLQLPMTNDPSADGYAPSTDDHVYRYQFGRRDALMSVRHAGRVVASAGYDPFTVEDLSKSNGTRPPGHGSHTNGKDVDISVYRENGEATWEHLCQATSAAECVPGTDTGFDGRRNALAIAAFLESARVTRIFLDREFHETLFDGAQELVDDGIIAQDIVPYMEDVVMHWPNHHGHFHIRFSESGY